jgi:hypothetical protein
MLLNISCAKQIVRLFGFYAKSILDLLKAAAPLPRFEKERGNVYLEKQTSVSMWPFDNGLVRSTRSANSRS